MVSMLLLRKSDVLRRLSARRRPVKPAIAGSPGDDPVAIDLTQELQWQDRGELVEDFEEKMESFLAFEDERDRAERTWLFSSQGVDGLPRS